MQFHVVEAKVSFKWRTSVLSVSFPGVRLTSYHHERPGYDGVKRKLDHVITPVSVFQMKCLTVLRAWHLPLHLRSLSHFTDMRSRWGTPRVDTGGSRRTIPQLVETRSLLMGM